MLFSLLFNASHYHHSPAWEELHSFLNVANRQSASYNFHRVEEGGIPLMGWGVLWDGLSRGFHADLEERQLSLAVERILRLNFILESSQQKVFVSALNLI